MVGAGTVRRDDPELTVRLADGRDPARVVVTHDGILPPQAKVLAGARQVRTIVVADKVTDATRRLLDARGAELIEVGKGGLKAALEALAGMGLLDILCEGGPTLAGELLAADLIDRVLCSWRRSSSGAARPTCSRRRPSPPSTAPGASRTSSGARSATTCCSAAPSCHRGAARMFTGIVEEVGHAARPRVGRRERGARHLGARTVTADAPSATASSPTASASRSRRCARAASAPTPCRRPCVAPRCRSAAGRPAQPRAGHDAAARRLGGHLVSGHIDGVGVGHVGHARGQRPRASRSRRRRRCLVSPSTRGRSPWTA